MVVGRRYLQPRLGRRLLTFSAIRVGTGPTGAHPSFSAGGTNAADLAAARGYQDILYEVRDQVAWVTINRPRVLNAFREQSLDEMIDALKSTHDDPSIACAVVTRKEAVVAGHGPTQRQSDSLLAGEDGGINAVVVREIIAAAGPIIHRHGHVGQGERIHIAVDGACGDVHDRAQALGRHLAAGLQQ